MFFTLESLEEDSEGQDLVNNLQMMEACSPSVSTQLYPEVYFSRFSMKYRTITYLTYPY